MSAQNPQLQNPSSPHSTENPANPSVAVANPNGLLRTRTNTAEIDSTIIHPGSVKINVTGAFIVDQDSCSPKEIELNVNANHYDTKDIRLPNHTAVVSHIAVDVCFPFPDQSKLARMRSR
jgi:type II pantothenate kinase